MTLCYKCKRGKPEEEFYKRNGKLRKPCISCLSAYARLRFLKNKIKQPKRKTCSCCKKSKTINDFSPAQAMCKECKRIKQAEYRQANPSTYRIPNKIYEERIRALNTAVYQRIKLIRKLRSRIRMALKHAQTKKCTSSTILLGCSIPELRNHIEKQFTEGMSWEHVDSGKIHIDHIKPCSSFDLTTESGQRACFHFTNLQPLWASDNLKKGAS